MKRKLYRSKSVQLAEFCTLGEKITERHGVLCGIQRVSSYTDSSGLYHPSGWTVSVDGQSFFAPSVDAGICVLRGFDFGLEFHICKTAGRGYVSRVDCLEIVRDEVRRFIGETIVKGKAAQ